MSKDRINIPVEVTGANEAQEQLRDVKGAVEDVGQADQRHATTKGQVAEKTNQATKSQDQFNDSAKTAMTGILGRLSPEMASLATVAVDVAKGVGQASVALVGMLGAGAAIGGLVMVFRKIAEATERVARAAERGVAAARKMREEGASRRREVAEQLRDAGIGASAAGPIARRAAMRQHAEGVPFEVTAQAEIGRRLYGLAWAIVRVDGSARGYLRTCLDVATGSFAFATVALELYRDVPAEWLAGRPERPRDPRGGSSGVPPGHLN